jgi:hypothetical protein
MTQVYLTLSGPPVRDRVLWRLSMERRDDTRVMLRSDRDPE